MSIDREKAARAGYQADPVIETDGQTFYEERPFDWLSDGEKLREQRRADAVIAAVLDGLSEPSKDARWAGYYAAFIERHHRKSDGHELDGQLWRWLDVAWVASIKAERDRLAKEATDGTD